MSSQPETATAVSAKNAQILLVTEYGQGNASEIILLVASNLNLTKFTVSSGDTVDLALVTNKVSHKAIDLIVITPHAQPVDRIIADLKKYWGVTITRPETGIGSGKTCIVVDVRHNCGRQQGDSCESCRQGIVNHQASIS